MSKKACRLDQRNQIYMDFKLACNHLLHSKQRDPGEANRRPKKQNRKEKKTLLLENILQGETFCCVNYKRRQTQIQ